MSIIIVMVTVVFIMIVITILSVLTLVRRGGSGWHGRGPRCSRSLLTRLSDGLSHERFQFAPFKP